MRKKNCNTWLSGPPGLTFSRIINPNLVREFWSPGYQPLTRPKQERLTNTHGSIPGVSCPKAQCTAKGRMVFTQSLKDASFIEVVTWLFPC